jgi:hypothetical protein
LERNINYENGPRYPTGYIKYRITEYDYINYWFFLPGDDWFSSLLDDDIKTLETKIKEKTGSLPYIEEKLVDC